jgi:mono/diheme cytochrome c family protein
MRHIFYLLLLSVAFAACSGGGNTTDEKKEVKSTNPMDNIGIGPIKEVKLAAEIDHEMAARGKEVYDAKCLACHKPEERFIGPAPKGILERRNPAWIMNMILSPDKMIIDDPDARKLLMEYNGAPMANQNITEEEARAILEYFRTL